MCAHESRHVHPIIHAIGICVKKNTVSLWFDTMAEVTPDMMAEGPQGPPLSGLRTEAVTGTRRCVQVSITFDAQLTSPVVRKN